MDSSSRIAPSFTVIFCAFCGSSLCFLPLVNETGSTLKNIATKSMMVTLSDSAYQICIVASLSVAIPIFMEIFLDSLFLSIEFFHSIKITLWMLILSSIVSSVITLFVAIPYANDAIMACMIPAVSIIVLCSCLCILGAYGNEIWKLKFSWPVLIFYSIGSIVSSHISFTENGAKNTYLYNAMYAFWGIAFFLLMYLSLLWARRIFTILRSKEPLPNDDLCCSLNLVAVIIYWVIDVVLLFYYCNGDVLQAGTTYHIARSYLLSVFVVVITALNARFVRAAMILSSALREAETKRMLVGYFSHEIRTPLNSVLMGLQVVEKDIKNGTPSSEVLSVIDELHTQCDLAVDILNDLLLYERLEEGIIDLNLKPVPIKSFIKKKVRALLPQCTAKQITLDLKLPDTRRFRGLPSFDRAYCRGDEDKLGQVLRTLLSNAIECTPPMGTITVKVDVLSTLGTEEVSRSEVHTNASAVADGQDVVVKTSMSKSFRAKSAKVLQSSHGGSDDEWKLQIRIIDSGPGISPEDQRSIFDNALSFTAGVLQVRQGKGLGLWISHSIIEHHEGCLSVCSDGVQGSTFTIEMPSYFATATGRVKWRSGSTSEYISKHIRFSMSSNIPHVPSTNAMSDVIEVISGNIMRTKKPEGDHSPRGNGVAHDIPESQMQSDAGGFKLLRQSSGVKPKPPRESSLSHFHDMKVNSFYVGYVGDGRALDETMDEKSDREVQLPMRKDDREDVVVAQTLPAKMHLPTRSRMVLVVDDAPMNRRMLCRLLEGHCGSTVEAEDGAVAVEKLKSSIEDGNPFVLVLMDYQMPNMDGPTAARRMRDMGYTGPIVGVTGNTLPHHIRTFIDGGANYVVNKPLSFDTLKRTLTEIGMADVLRRRGDEKCDEYDI